LFQNELADRCRVTPSTVERWMREKTVIVVMSTSPARAAKQATSIIPIVVGGMADPVGDELVVSFDRPAGNITGTTFIGPELIAKRFELLKDVTSGLLASPHFGILLHTRNAQWKAC